MEFISINAIINLVQPLFKLSDTGSKKGKYIIYIKDFSDNEIRGQGNTIDEALVEFCTNIHKVLRKKERVESDAEIWKDWQTIRQIIQMKV